MEMSRDQCRAARGLLGWTQDQLATAASVSKKTLADYESGKRTPYDRTLADIATIAILFGTVGLWAATEH